MLITLLTGVNMIVSISIDSDLLKKIDAARGLVPRSAWRAAAAERELERQWKENAVIAAMEAALRARV